MADKAQHTLLQYGDAATPEKFKTLGEVITITGPALSNPTLDASNLDDTARDKISGGIVDAGQVVLGLKLDGATTSDHDALIDKIIAGPAASNYALCWSNFVARELAISSVSVAGDSMDTAVDHQLRTGQAVRFMTTDTLPDPLAEATTYYAIRTDRNTFQVATTHALAFAGTQVVLTDVGAGTHQVSCGAAKELTISAVDTAAETVDSSAAHGLHTGQPIRFLTSGTLPAPLVEGTTYYAIYVDADTIKIAATNALAFAGTAVNLTADGAGTRRITAGSKWTFAASVVEAGPAASVGEAVDGDLTFDVTDTVTIST